MIKTDNYHHIYNGGVSITLKTEEDYTSIEFNADYYGYPSIASTIHIGSEPLEILEMFRDAITKHIAKVKLDQ